MSGGNERGLVYLAVGEEFVQEAKISATQAKSVMPDVPVTLLSDIEADHESFDDVIRIENPRRDGGDRVFNADKTPYDKTIFLDTDVYIAEPIDEIFEMLDSYDVAACINDYDFSSERIDMTEINELPECFPEYNGGVIAFRRNDRTEDFLSKWRETYRKVVEHGQLHNQASLRYALYHSDARIATMRDEYNCVYRRPGCVNGPVKVFHGRLLDIDSYGAREWVDIEQAVAELNSQGGLRAYYRFGDRVRLVKSGIIEKGLFTIGDRGLVETMKQVPSFLKQRLTK